MLGYFISELVCLGRSTLTKMYVALKGRDIIGWKDLEKLHIHLIPGADKPVVLAQIPDVALLDCDNQQNELESILKKFDGSI